MSGLHTFQCLNRVARFWLITKKGYRGFDVGIWEMPIGSTQAWLLEISLRFYGRWPLCYPWCYWSLAHEIRHDR